MENSCLHKTNRLLILVIITLLPAIILFSCNKSDTTTPNTVIPKASFTYSSARVFPVSVQFTSLPANPIPGVATYVWFFGDGSYSTLPHPVHAYTSAGTYMVMLALTYNDATKDTVVKTMQLNANGPGGVSAKQANISAADFTFSIPAVYLVTFTNTSTNANSYLWNFGDGNTSASSAPTINHQYNAAGPFTVTLKASNGAETDSCRATFNF